MDKQWMKDPLRYAMEARLSGKKRFALGAVLTLVFLLAAVKLCAAMEGAAVIALTGACCAALLTWGAWRRHWHWSLFRCAATWRRSSPLRFCRCRH